MTIASNTGPLIALAKADQLILLRTFYGDVLIPPGVHRELLEQIRDRGYWLSDELIEAAERLAGE